MSGVKAIRRTGPPPVRRYQPLVPAAVAVVVGVLAGEYVGGSVLVWCLLASAAAAVWIVLFFLRRRDAPLLVPLLVLLAAAGAARYRVAVAPSADDVERLVLGGQRLVVLEGIVTRSARESRPPTDVFLPSVPYYVRSTLAVEVEQVRADQRQEAASGEVTVTVRQPLPKDVRRLPALGDRIRIVGILMPLAQPMNPGGFDVSKYLRRQGVRASIQTDHWEAVQVVAPRADRLLGAAGAVQRWALRRLERMPTDEGRAVISAVMFGRRDLLAAESGLEGTADIEESFILSGTAYFMAVAGLHVIMVAMVVLLPTRLLGLSPRTTAMLVALVTLAYAVMADLSPPVVRASILVWVMCLGWILGRPPRTVNSLGASILIILLLWPADLFTAGLQLSYITVLGLLFLARKSHDWMFRPHDDLLNLAEPAWRRSFVWQKLLAGNFSVSVAASLVSVPLIAYEFHLVTWLSPISSPILLPLVFALLASSVALVAFGWISTSVGTLLAIVPDGLARLLAYVVQGLAHVPYGHLYTSGVSLGWVLACYALLAAWAWREPLGLSRRRLGMAALAAAGAFVWTTGHAAPESPRATFLSVGNGNCNLLELPSGHVILYDVGSSLSRSRAAESLIAPALCSRRIDRIDAVFFSHAHFDHFKDILPIADRFRVAKVLVPPTFMRKRLRCDDAVIEALLARGITVEYFSGGDRLRGAGDVEIRGVWPHGPGSMVKSLNEGSLVLEVGSGGRRLLLTGDLEAGGLGSLLNREPALRADAILWPHHGANTAAVGRFCRAAGVRTVVLSAGRMIPPRAPPAWVAEQGIALYHTGADGAVTVELRPEGVAVETFCAREAPGPDADDEENFSDPDHEVIGVDDLIVRPFAEDLGELARLEALDLIDIF